MMPSALAVFGLMAGPMRSGLMSLLGQRLTPSRESSRSALPSHQKRTFAEAAKWAFPFKKTEDLAYEPGPPVRILFAPEN